MAGRGRTWILWLSVLVVVGALAFIGSALATDKSSFCGTCHEMKPYNDAWAKGPHAKEAECIDCHVNHPLPERFAHKFVALKEVWAHFTGDTLFPRPTPPEVPDARCLRCHKDLPAMVGEFPHGLHAKKGACQGCHYDTGHNVTESALKRAGVLNPDVKVERPSFKYASIGDGKANLPGHPAVSCSRCHDMKLTPCTWCHKHPKEDHPDIGSRDCSACHKPAAKFVFRHPGAAANCTSCHEAPKEEHPRFKGRTCVECHRRPGRSWDFSHPGATAVCSECHTRPERHFRGACSECHRRPGANWGFTHSGGTGEHSYRSFACVNCHPTSFRVARCTCHVDKGVPRD